MLVITAKFLIDNNTSQIISTKHTTKNILKTKNETHCTIKLELLHLLHILIKEKHLNRYENLDKSKSLLSLVTQKPLN